MVLERAFVVGRARQRECARAADFFAAGCARGRAAMGRRAPRCAVNLDRLGEGRRDKDVEHCPSAAQGRGGFYQRVDQHAVKYARDAAIVVVLPPVEEASAVEESQLRSCQ